jgi:hypothetical protein
MPIRSIPIPTGVRGPLRRPDLLSRNVPHLAVNTFSMVAFWSREGIGSPGKEPRAESA